MNSWARKPLSIIGASPGTLGTALAQAQLRSTMTILECVLMGQPEVYLTFKSGLIGDDDEITNEETRKFLGDYVNLFAAWVARYKS
jgi:chromate reductase